MRRAIARAMLAAPLLAACGSSGAQGPAPIAVVSLADAGGIGSSGATPVASAEPPPAMVGARDDRRIAKMMKRVTDARGLVSQRAVPGVVLARDVLIAKVKGHVDREVPPEAIRHEGLVLQLLGFVPTTFDYEAETFKLLDAQLAGFYEPEDGTMYMAADLDGDNAEATLAHELDHALQDQHFDLKRHSKYEPGKSDEQAAFSALAEGDATSVMADVLLARAAPGRTALDLPEEVFVEQVMEGVSSGAAAKAPKVMRASLAAPYIFGTLFVNALRRSGGWAAVDGAWGALPTTTEQVLHLDKWRSREPALDVKGPTFAALGAGWAKSDEDTNGELGMRLAFEEWMGAEHAAKASAGWGGDRAVLIENGDRAAIGLRVRYDARRVLSGSGKGEDTFTLVADGLVASLGKPAARDAGWVCIERAQLGPIGVMVRERDLVLVAGPAKMGGTWVSAADCALARRWASEIASAK